MGRISPVSSSHDDLSWLQTWVSREFGDADVTTVNPWVQLETNDPGWAATISLTGTAMENVDFREVELIRSEADWFHCWIDGGVSSSDLEWQGRCGGSNLVEMVGLFQSWVEAQRTGANT
jgi:hypothetical protein